ncbi:APOD [Branchiostoma lanceolatum]|uniref:APOD protein n=1 Tax=Branchiostoma lanceolatum TaxID=7740 RepID=A0A8J9YRB0_BRALA|nr:APOD [Branchiostoma lanceolatum]
MLPAVFVSAVLALTVPATHGFVLGLGACPDLPPVKGFDVADWASGEWLETTRFPFLFTSDVSCSRASFSLQKDGTYKFTYDGRRAGSRGSEPIDTVDFLYLENGPGDDPADMKVVHEDYSWLPVKLGYRIVAWKPDDESSGGYFVHFGCKHFFGLFNAQNLSIYQRRVDPGQSAGILRDLALEGIDMSKGSYIDQRNCPPIGEEGSGDRIPDWMAP